MLHGTRRKTAGRGSRSSSSSLRIQRARETPGTTTRREMVGMMMHRILYNHPEFWSGVVVGSFGFGFGWVVTSLIQAVA